MADEADITLDVSKLKVPDLKKELRSRGLPITGNKNELIERLNSSLQNSKLDTDSVDDLIDEDLLNDDEEEHLEGDTDLNITDLETTIESPEAVTKTQNPLKRKVDEINNVSESKGPKKLVLNRKLSSSEELGLVSSNGNSAVDNSSITNEPTETNGKALEDKKVVKLSELTAKERLEMRTKKFGAPVTDVAKKAVRAARFGESTTVSSTGTVNIGNGSSTSVDMLKKRAERFGSVVSTALSKVEVQEKLEKRKQRFGTTTAAPASKLDQDKAKQQRLERFKTSVK